MGAMAIDHMLGKGGKHASIKVKNYVSSHCRHRFLFQLYTEDSIKVSGCSCLMCVENLAHVKHAPVLTHNCLSAIIDGNFH